MTTTEPATPHITDLPPTREFVYVGDTMCSWCYGFSPVLRRVASTYDIPMRVKVGGLRPFEHAQPLDDQFKKFLATEWERIGEVTGRPFSTAALEREGALYDTGPADQAVVAARNLEEPATLDFFAMIQQAFYAKGRDITQREVLLDVAADFGFDRDTFGTLYDNAHEETRADFLETQSWGVTSYPTLLIRDGGELIRVATGYVPFDELKRRLDGWLRDHPVAENTTPMACDVETGLC